MPNQDCDRSGREVATGKFEDSSRRGRINASGETRGKMSDHFVLCEDKLYYVGMRPLRSDQQQEDAMLCLVVPSTMIQEVLQNCHDSLERGHQGIARTFYRVKLDFYWIGLYADVARHMRSCLDCSSSKRRPKIRGYSPGNILAERPFQVVSMDLVIPLPKSRRGNTALLLFQCAFTGYVMGKATADTTALRVAQAFEECVYRRFGAPSLIRHDRDPRFMSEVFQSFTEMMQSRCRAKLSYRPQANDQQERSVKTVMQSVRVYAEDPLQQDWDEIKLIFAINNSMDTTRKETFFPRPRMGRSVYTQGDVLYALACRREVNRQQEIALKMAKEYQATEKARRAKKHNETLRSREGGMTPEIGQTVKPSGEQSVTGVVTEGSDGDATGDPRSLFEVGSRVWHYMEAGIDEKVEEFAYELELPDRSGYTFYPAVHLSRLKTVDEFGDRPNARLTSDVNETSRLDLMKGWSQSWESDHVAGEFEVEAILDDMTPLFTITSRAVREYKMKRVSCDDPTWEPASNLSCGGLLYAYLREKRRD
ncbi:LOW QUALITY PROTEIN: hypothetical protein PHMEG_00027949 [Phytophthora megakarya]|uniref:Integrase catalytic domain-containing protein n=1 Tax=Phytophthora megakarya TaxID=4795 RepID=A0A225V7Q3_9STRA|nr:LOW QUALITY PROTEIN: hypothetical protein PHMEG_00027949 [Phytophthora megakarya]